MRPSATLAFLILITTAPLALADDAAIKKQVKADVQSMNDAMNAGDFARIADLSHPRVVEMTGGRAKMIALMERATKEMKDQGTEVRGSKVDDPSDIVEANADLYVVVPFLLEGNVQGTKFKSKGFVVGVSADKGKTWKYVNGDVNRDKVKQLLPELPSKLKLPEPNKPEFEKP